MSLARIKIHAASTKLICQGNRHRSLIFVSGRRSVESCSANLQSSSRLSRNTPAVSSALTFSSHRPRPREPASTYCEKAQLEILSLSYASPSSFLMMSFVRALFRTSDMITVSPFSRKGRLFVLWQNRPVSR